MPIEIGNVCDTCLQTIKPGQTVRLLYVGEAEYVEEMPGTLSLNPSNATIVVEHVECPPREAKP